MRYWQVLLFPKNVEMPIFGLILSSVLYTWYVLRFQIINHFTSKGKHNQSLTEHCWFQRQLVAASSLPSRPAFNSTARSRSTARFTPSTRARTARRPSWPSPLLVTSRYGRCEQTTPCMVYTYCCAYWMICVMCVGIY